MVELVLKSLTVLSDTTAAVTFEGDDGGEVTFQFELHETGPQGLTVTNGDPPSWRGTGGFLGRRSRCGLSALWLRPCSHGGSRFRTVLSWSG